MSSDHHLICKNVHKTYHQGTLSVHALRGVDLSVAQGEFLSLAGASGSGKTTLLNLIGGLDTISEGEVFIDGETLSDKSRSALAELRLNKIGFVFQAYNLIPVLTAIENVEFVMQLQGVGATERQQRATAILQRVGLGDMLARKPAELSGGQQQRVAVARALVSNPAIVLADEPTANLDSQTSADLLQLMAELNSEFSTTIIVATHDPQVIEFTRRKVYLKDGQIQSDTH